MLSGHTFAANGTDLRGDFEICGDVTVSGIELPTGAVKSWFASDLEECKVQVRIDRAFRELSSGDPHFKEHFTAFAARLSSEFISGHSVTDVFFVCDNNREHFDIGTSDEKLGISGATLIGGNLYVYCGKIPDTFMTYDVVHWCSNLRKVFPMTMVSKRFRFG